MDLTPYVASLRDHLLAAAAAGGDEATALAQRLVLPLDAATRLTLMEALSRAADDLTTQIAPGTIEVRLRGGEPQFAVRLPDQGFEEPRLPRAQPPLPVGGGTGGGGTGGGTGGSEGGATGDPAAEDGAPSRISLRLPDHLKTRAEAAAADQGLSLNAWLTAVVAAAVADGASGGVGDAKQRRRRRSGESRSQYTGWAR